MSPAQAKSDELLAAAIEQRDRDQIEVAKVNPECVIPTPFKLIAFRQILAPRVLEYLLQDSTARACTTTTRFGAKYTPMLCDGAGRPWPRDQP